MKQVAKNKQLSDLSVHTDVMNNNFTGTHLSDSPDFPTEEPYFNLNYTIYN